MLWVLGNAFAKWHHQLRVRGMILHSVMLWKTTSEPDTSYSSFSLQPGKVQNHHPPGTDYSQMSMGFPGRGCWSFELIGALETLYGGQFTLSTQLIKPNYLVIPQTNEVPLSLSLPSAKSQFGKWLKKPFFTLMSQRLIDLMRTRLFYERNFIGQLASMEEMERYVFLWPWSTTGWTEESLLPFQQHEYSKLLYLSLRREIQIFERFVVAELRAERADWVLSRFSV